MALQTWDIQTLSKERGHKVFYIWTQNQLLKFSPNLFIIYMLLYLMADIRMWLNVIAWIFEGNLYFFCLNWITLLFLFALVLEPEIHYYFVLIWVCFRVETTKRFLSHENSIASLLSDNIGGKILRWNLLFGAFL